MDISFIILTWNSERYIENCINSIHSSLNGSRYRYQVFIVDNGSSDNTVGILERLKNDCPDILNLIMLKKNTGTTYSRNVALKKAKGRYICIMDSDVQIFPETLEGLIATLQHHPDAGLAVPEIRYPDGKLQKSIDRFPTITRKIYRYFFLKNLEKKENQVDRPRKPVEADYAISACWVMKKDVIYKVGFLDEKIFYAPEDVDFCLRVWRAGYKIIYNPTVKIIHHTQEISRGFKINSALLNHIKGLIYYFIKHRYFFKAPSFRMTEK